MIAMQLSEAAKVVGGALSGRDGDFSGVSTDTRSLTEHQLFFALRGPRFDGHDKLNEASAAGAAGAVVQQCNSDPSLSLIYTTDSRRSLGSLARSWRRRFQLPVLAITGSSGKTTVKEMLASIVRVRGTTLATQGNLNNDIGVPLTLFGLNSKHEFAVVEMGASQRGDIAWLSEVACPTVSLITMAAPAHLESFGDIETVARTKGEILSGLDPQGVAIINNEDPFAPMWVQMASGRQVITFGEGGIVEASAVADDGAHISFRLSTDIGAADVSIAHRGRHNVSNALAAAAAARAVDFDLESIRLGLEQVGPIPRRLQVQRGIDGVRLIDDSYNANPASLQAAINVLADEFGEKWLVLGDMAELGGESEAYHRAAGIAASRARVDRLYTIGDLAKFAAFEFGNAATHVRDQASLINELVEAIRVANFDRLTILIKGSRTMALEEVVDALAEPGDPLC